jgi:hypothetical protein
MNCKWISRGLAGLSFGLGALLFFLFGATYEGFEMMTAMTVVILCWPAFHSLFTWRMLLLTLLIIAPISLLFQCLAVKNSIWVYGLNPYYLGHLHWWQLKMPWMEVVFYFLFPIFQLGLFSFFYRASTPRTLKAKWSLILPVILFLLPLAFAAQSIYLQINRWQTGIRSVDWNCAIMGTAFAVTLITYGFSKAYRRFVRSWFFGIWTLVMGTYMFFWEYFHTVLHDHWRYVLSECLFPPWIVIDPATGLGLSQAQAYGYFMTATVFPATAFLVSQIWKEAMQPGTSFLKEVSA